MSEERIGRTIAGKYRIIRLLGEGGMGAVYEALHTVIGRRFAVKFLHLALASSADITARFRREAQAAGSLESENIAAVTDFGNDDDGSPFIVMEYLVGDDLSRLLTREGAMPVRRIVEIVIQACRGLHAAHSAGIVHRDLKPENLFVSKRGDGSDLVKVLDFGIAKLRAVEGTPSATRTGTTMGTPYYMPPEQARGAKDIDHRADIYALGVILYEALSGAKPHPGDSYNAILYHILSQPPAPLDSLRPQLPAGLSALVHRALSFEANDRFASVSDLIEALAPYAGRSITPLDSNRPLEASGAAVTIATPPSLALPSAASSVPNETIALPMHGRPSRSLLIVAVAVAAALGLAALLMLRKSAAPGELQTDGSAAAVAAPVVPLSPSAAATAPEVAPVVAAPTTEASAAPGPSTVSTPGRPRTPAAAPKPVNHATASPVPDAQKPDSPGVSAKKGQRSLSFDKSNPYQQ